MFWSDLGKRATAKPQSKTWDDGTEITTAHGHAKKSVEILDEVVSKLDTPPWWYEPVRWLVAEHMNFQEFEANKEKTVAYTSISLLSNRGLSGFRKGQLGNDLERAPWRLQSVFWKVRIQLD